MLALVYDTETNRLPLWSSPDDNPLQPHVIQIAAALYDTEQRRPVSSINLISKPGDYEFDENAVNVHGITKEYAEQIGIPEPIALAAFYSLWEKAEIRVAHNEKFDTRIVRIALMRFGTSKEVEKWDAGSSFCTMQAAKPIVQAKNVRGALKLPNLGEAYKYFTGNDLPQAHTAHGDTRGCAAVYFAINDYLALLSKEG